MTLKDNLPTKEDLQTFFGVAAISILPPVAIVVAIVGIVFAWTFLFTILVIIGAFASVVGIIVLYGLLRTLIGEPKEK